MTTTAVLVKFFSTEWIEINEYLNKKVHPTGKQWVNDCASTTSVSACVCRERGRSPNLWLYLFGHFHCAWYLTWYAIEMQYIHLKTTAHLLTCAFVCKHKVFV